MDRRLGVAALGILAGITVTLFMLSECGRKPLLLPSIEDRLTRIERKIQDLDRLLKP